MYLQKGQTIEEMQFSLELSSEASGFLTQMCGEFAIRCKNASDMAYYHHEKWNGTGYPKGLQGEDIPLSARILAVADVYDALTSARSYKEPFSHEKTVSIILDEDGISFDPRIISVFRTVEDQFAAAKESF